MGFSGIGVGGWGDVFVCSMGGGGIISGSGTRSISISMGSLGGVGRS
jgi:hypothetical protein